ncbi:ABC transporter ATP-binding protein [Lachnospiraceae bacterium]|jgi:putative ABC transport system ATP-binding protein|nr:ABC transporter ATP-binding protein [uncultured Schaedlerella sp.]MCI9153946.1 ABC transporter ATP-binding protein [Ruminococcus sp.]NBI60841.1 ABC transporter ATP-binding protein [Lachnospiraceae bacterium]
MGTVLEVRDLTKKYVEGTVESKVVDHVSLDVDEGEFVIIMGASGSGKTSILHLIAGIDTCSEGSIKYTLPDEVRRPADFARMNEKEKTMFRRANIGLVFQQQCLIPDLTVYENIMLPLMLDRNRKENAFKKDKIMNLCGRFGLKEHVRKYPSQLSGGQQQRTAILRSVANLPPLLLCDEPTGSLNSAQTELVMDLLEELNKGGQTIILVTHDIRVAARGKRVLYIEDGHVEGELDFTEHIPNGAEMHPDSGPDTAGTDAFHTIEDREEKLIHFLQERGW